MLFGLQADAGHFSAKDLAAVRAIAEEPDPLHLIVNSICPSIYGHETVLPRACARHCA
jgi:DNA replicative helicase MCM subunit Mcm2 (Cdc46/Mcm family)